MLPTHTERRSYNIWILQREDTFAPVVPRVEHEGTWDTGHPS